MIDHFARYTIPAAYALLPPKMNSFGATAMILAIGLQESRFKHRVQINGPAKGFLQFERAGLKGVLTHAVTKPILLPVLDALCYAPTLQVCYAAVEHNDTLACVFARLLLWTVPGRLARHDEPDKGWDDYLRGWRPGRPHRGSWDECFAEGWRLTFMQSGVRTDTP